MPETDDDPWDFLPKRQPASEPQPAEPAPIAKRERGELRAGMQTVSLKRRAFPMALSLLLVSVAGFLTEVVAASQVLASAGPEAMLIIYPLGGLGLLVLALLQFKYIDGKRRLPMIRVATLAYAAAFLLVLLAYNWSAGLGGGAAWLLADQLNFLLPLLIWSLAGDEFNVAEGRKIFGWMVIWTFAGQTVGLLISIAGAPLLTGLDLPLASLLVVAPLLCLFVGIWLPYAMRDAAAAKGLARTESVRESVRSAWDFVGGISVWQQFLAASTATFTAGMVLYIAVMTGFEEAIGADAARLQVTIGALALVSYVFCWLIQILWAERMQERIGIPGVLMVLPIAIVVGSAFALAGLWGTNLALLGVAFALWLVPRWGIDENARRAALALVPDERRARVSLLVDMGPIVVGLIVSGPLAAIGLLTGNLWVMPVLALVLALVALKPSVAVLRGWEDSLLSWRLRRRKRGRVIDDLFGEDDD